AFIPDVELDCAALGRQLRLPFDDPVRKLLMLSPLGPSACRGGEIKRETDGISHEARGIRGSLLHGLPQLSFLLFAELFEELGLKPPDFACGQGPKSFDTAIATIATNATVPAIGRHLWCAPKKLTAKFLERSTHARGIQTQVGYLRRGVGHDAVELVN